MSTAPRTLEIGALALPLHARHAIDQEYEQIGGRSLLRFADGTGLVQQAWSKLRTVISGQGSVPPGLALLDTLNPLVLKCIKARSVTAAGPSLTLPAARRSDAGSTPRGFAQVGQQGIETAVNIVGDTATLTPVPGAELYWVTYYPQITVHCEPVRETGDVNAGQHGWTLTAEEV